jgi:DNA-binding transcriptional LysR family regulator
MASSGLPGILPTCVARLYPELRPSDRLGGYSEHPIWLVYHESKRGDPKVTSTIKWLRDIFPSPNRCLCGQCERPEI